MKTKLTKSQAATRAATIRKQNVQRHDRAAAHSKLRDEILRKQINANRLNELHNFQEAAIRGSGIDQMALARINQLQGMVR